MRIRVVRSSRRSLALTIDRDGEVVVRSPFRTSERYIQAFVLEHRDWILKKQKEFEENLRKKAAEPVLTGEELKEIDRSAKTDIPVRVRHYAEILHVEYGRITIRNQKTKWGSCSSKGNLNFNCLLMLVPEYVRDYVVVHELCHRKEMNHSARFWNEVESMLPDYRTARKWLRDHGELVMSRNPKQ